jgi:carbohydrate-selective porin OprB
MTTVGAVHAEDRAISFELAFERVGRLDGGADVAAALGSVVYQTTLGDDSPWRVSTNLLWPVGESLSETLGDLGTVSNIDAPNGLRVQELWAERELRAGSARFGWLAADSEFWSTNSGGLFLHSAFGAPAILSTNSAAAPIYPSASFGLRFEQRWSSGRWRAAVFDGNTGDPADSRGLDLTVDQPLAAFELELGPEAATAPRLELSFAWNRSPKEPSGPWRSLSFVLASFELPLTRTSVGFARVGAAAGAERSTSHTFEAGVTAEIGRGVLGLACAALEFHPASLEPGSHHHRELIVEATYQLPAGDHLTLQPTLQRVLTPAREDAAWVFGIRVVVTP